MPSSESGLPLLLNLIIKATSELIASGVNFTLTNLVDWWLCDLEQMQASPIFERLSRVPPDGVAWTGEARSPSRDVPVTRPRFVWANPEGIEAS